MNKYFLSLILILLTGAVMAQKKGSLLHVIKSDSTHGTKVAGVELLKVYRGVFQQDNTIFSSDSAYLYTKENAIDAFGHIVITQGDTLHVFGDKLNYQGNTKIAIITDNVRLIDKDAILTTNYFTYNTGTKYGTYTGGGKLVNKENTLVSKNGYYFASSRDAYFRYDVVLNTTDAIIKTDTLRYNSGTRIAFFYGPTNIYGKKDKDTLYTENGTYNTQTEQAFFGKKNQYRQNTKTLKGDSLFYDRLQGYGKAVKHVTFTDTEQKIIMHGDLGETFKKSDRTLVTQHAYVVFVTEEKDTTKTSKKDTILANPKTGTVKKPALSAPNNTMPMIDPAQVKAGQDMAKVVLATTPKAKQDSIIAQAKTAAAKNGVKLPATLPKVDAAQVKTVQDIANVALARTPKTKQDQLIAQAKTAAAKNGVVLPKVKVPVDTAKSKTKTLAANLVKKDSVAKKDTSHIKRDSIFMTADTIETQIITYKELKEVKEARRLAGLRDTSIKVIPSIVYTKPVKYIEPAFAKIPSDTTVFHRGYFKPKLTVRDTSQKKAPEVVAKPGPKKIIKQAAPVVKKYVAIDSVNLSQEVKLADTARVRILVAAHHAKIFKSDLQAKADSIFFSYADSVARMYYKPMIWVQDSQLSADTINLQMKKKQLDNIELFPSSFVVNIEKGDSTHFNQVGGKKMRGYFKDSKMEKMFVFGNAETIYFDRDSGKVTQMHRTISSKIRVRFKSNEPLDIFWFVKPEARILPIGKLKEDDKILRGFLWKPEERPVSKESIINPKVVKPASKKSTGKPDPKKPSAKGDTKPEPKPGKTITDSVQIKPDTTLRFKPRPRPDTLLRTKPKTDTTKIKPHEQTKQQ